MNIGIDLISCYTPAFVFSLTELASQRKVDAHKYQHGIGQETMSVIPPDEDVVTMGVNAARKLLTKTNKESIKALIFATETGIDQSKSAGIFAHHLLGLGEDCRIIEMKQACYSSSFAVRTAMGLIHMEPDAKILVITSDIARYDLNSPGEATQGAGAVAMLLTINPRILTIETHSGFTCGDVMDFWRPNYRQNALVDGQYSAKIYLKALQVCWKKYLSKSNLNIEQIHQFCFHLPFTRMAEKALKQLFPSPTNLKKRLQNSLPALSYNRTIGNSYTASLFFSLCSLLDNVNKTLDEQRIGFFGYGSGFVAEFFSGILQENYQTQLFSEHHQQLIANRKTIDYQTYLSFYNFALPEDGSEFFTPQQTTQGCRLLGIKNHKRLYQITD